MRLTGWLSNCPQGLACPEVMKLLAILFSLRFSRQHLGVSHRPLPQPCSSFGYLFGSLSTRILNKCFRVISQMLVFPYGFQPKISPIYHYFSSFLKISMQDDPRRPDCSLRLDPFVSFLPTSQSVCLQPVTNGRERYNGFL